MLENISKTNQQTILYLLFYLYDYNLYRTQQQYIQQRQNHVKINQNLKAQPKPLSSKTK